MTTEEFKRKLTTILHADVKDYSRLMGEDEDATVSTLTTYREVMGMFIQKHRGRVVHGTGDSLLAEFISVVDAVQCAVLSVARAGAVHAAQVSSTGGLYNRYVYTLTEIWCQSVFYGAD